MLFTNSGRMRKRIRSRSGWAILTAAGLAASAAGCTRPAPPPLAAAPAQIGRFVIVHSPQVERDVILLDTVTGETWSRVETGSGADDGAAWEIMPKIEPANPK